MSEKQKELMTIDDFLEIYNVGKNRYYSLVKNGLLKVTKLGRSVFIKRTDADAWMQQIGKED